MQCLNIAAPLGQGLWEGVPLREVLRLCGPLRNVRRIYYWGFHNNDPKQLFQSSLSYTQAMETPPGELPAFLAYRLNGEPIPLKRGGPVRMIVPWAHGFKSIKWLQHIALTNDFRANDTYANPEQRSRVASQDRGLHRSRRRRNFPRASPSSSAGCALSGLSGLQARGILAASRGAGREARDAGRRNLSRRASGRRANSKRRPRTGARVLPPGISAEGRARL